MFYPSFFSFISHLLGIFIEFLFQRNQRNKRYHYILIKNQTRVKAGQEAYYYLLIGFFFLFCDSCTLYLNVEKFFLTVEKNNSSSSIHVSTNLFFELSLDLSDFMNIWKHSDRSFVNDSFDTCFIVSKPHTS